MQAENFWKFLRKLAHFVVENFDELFWFLDFNVPVEVIIGEVRFVKGKNIKNVLKKDVKNHF